jgi:hypothetical protein
VINNKVTIKIMKNKLIKIISLLTIILCVWFLLNTEALSEIFNLRRWRGELPFSSSLGWENIKSSQLKVNGRGVKLNIAYTKKTLKEAFSILQASLEKEGFKTVFGNPGEYGIGVAKKGKNVYKFLGMEADSDSDAGSIVYVIKYKGFLGGKNTVLNNEFSCPGGELVFNLEHKNESRLYVFNSGNSKEEILGNYKENLIKEGWRLLSEGDVSFFKKGKKFCSLYIAESDFESKVYVVVR